MIEVVDQKQEVVRDKVIEDIDIIKEIFVDFEEHLSMEDLDRIVEVLNIVDSI